MAFTAITVTAHYEDPEGNDSTGTVQFTLSQVMRDGLTGPFVAPTVINATLVSGAISVALFANDDSTTQPQGTFYKVAENIAGSSRTYNISVPSTAPDATIDLSALAP